MSLHVLSHPWTVQETEDGILIQLRPQDLTCQSIAVLAEELYDLALESNRPTLTLDFAEVKCLASVVVGKLFALSRRLREVGGRLVLSNLKSGIEELLRAECWPDPSNA